ncbi:MULTISPECIES: hypothetical protein [Bartonella]|uniref:hypothetical protein n=1 Tax=Bartonella TaxID=773 RepID=UPI0018DB77C7|nr:MULTISPECIES: hypothetical protein [Bartonella]MBH9975272.1 hypothetical protein [Bartonella choladocola]MBI0014879.1 hypothetical protein [Bartonella sp. B10834G3]MBI0140454.1 hypothetical protein [Bartonella choladocola]
MENATDMVLKARSHNFENPLLTLRSLQQAALKLHGLKATPNGLGTRSLLGLLICQTQRNRRMALPPVRVHLRVASPRGSFGVKLRLGSTNS